MSSSVGYAIVGVSGSNGAALLLENRLEIAECVEAARLEGVMERSRRGGRSRDVLRPVGDAGSMSGDPRDPLSSVEPSAPFVEDFVLLMFFLLSSINSFMVPDIIFMKACLLEPERFSFSLPSTGVPVSGVPATEVSRGTIDGDKSAISSFSCREEVIEASLEPASSGEGTSVGTADVVVGVSGILFEGGESDVFS